MVFMDRCTLGLILVLLSFTSLHSASIRNVREVQENPETSTAIAQANRGRVRYFTTLEPDEVKTTTEDGGAGVDGISKTTVATDDNTTASVIEETTKNLSSNLVLISNDNTTNTVSTTTIKPLNLNIIKDEPSKNLNKIITDSEATEKARSLDFDISKYTSEDFHDKNNVYNQPISPENAKYVISEYEQPKTPKFTFSTELTTPSTFDNHDAYSEENRFDESKPNTTKTNWKIFKYTNSISDSKNPKNSEAKERLSLEVDSSYNDTVVVGESVTETLPVLTTTTRRHHPTKGSTYDKTKKEVSVLNNKIEIIENPEISEDTKKIAINIHKRGSTKFLASTTTQASTSKKIEEFKEPAVQENNVYPVVVPASTETMFEITDTVVTTELTTAMVSDERFFEMTEENVAETTTEVVPTLQTTEVVEDTPSTQTTEVVDDTPSIQTTEVVDDTSSLSTTEVVDDTPSPQTTEVIDGLQNTIPTVFEQTTTTENFIAELSTIETTTVDFVLNDTTTTTIAFEHNQTEEISTINYNAILKLNDTTTDIIPIITTLPPVQTSTTTEEPLENFITKENVSKSNETPNKVVTNPEIEEEGDDNLDDLEYTDLQAKKPNKTNNEELEIIHIEPVDRDHTTLHTEIKKPDHTYPNPEIITVSAKEGTEIDGVTEESRYEDEESNGGTVIAIIISTVGAICLVILAVLLYIMRRRQNKFNYGQRCTPVGLDAYSMDNVSVYNSVRRKAAMRSSKRSYGNPAFDDITVSNPLNFQALVRFSTNTDEVSKEFEQIPQVTARTTELPEGCETKNRYANVIPLPETRVILSAVDCDPTGDYINANYVTGPKGVPNYYIACQAPLQSTVNDFWRMVWEQQSKVILMLTHLFESGAEKCSDYLPPSEVLDCHRLFGDYQVTLKKREVKDKYIISTLQLKNMVSNSWRGVTHLWYTGWPEKGVPSEENSLIAFLIEARSFIKLVQNNVEIKAKESNGDIHDVHPAVVHCSPGTGRTGTVLACDIAIREFELRRVVDIPKIVYRIRRDRASSVQTKDQYNYIYKVINMYATKLTGGGLDSI